MNPENPHLDIKLSQADLFLLEEEMARLNVDQDSLVQQIIHWWALLVDFNPKRSDFTFVLPLEYSALTTDETLPDFLSRLEVFVVQAVRAREVTWVRTSIRLQCDRKRLYFIIRDKGRVRTVAPKPDRKTISNAAAPHSYYRNILSDSLASDLALLTMEARRRKTHVNFLAGNIVHQWLNEHVKNREEKRRIILPAEACVLYQDDSLDTFLNRVELAAIQATCFVESNPAAVASRLGCAPIRKIVATIINGKRRSFRSTSSKESTQENPTTTGAIPRVQQDKLIQLLEANRIALVLQECNYDSAAASALFGTTEYLVKQTVDTPVQPAIAAGLIATQPSHNPANNELALQAVQAINHLPGAATLSLADLERALILSVLERTNHDLRRAAPVLGISPLALRRKLAAYNSRP
jgi:hypothetical protein